MKIKRDFPTGYADGWQSILGKGTSPPIPQHSIPPGKGEYQAGYERGRKDALVRKKTERQ